MPIASMPCSRVAPNARALPSSPQGLGRGLGFRAYLIAALLLLVQVSAMAQDGPRLYDIEVLVFRHIGQSTLSPKAIQDFTNLPIPGHHASQDEESYLTPSSGMETAWRKLNNSGAYEALYFTRWRQTTSRYNRPRRYRLHNDVPLYRPGEEPLEEFFDADESDEFGTLNNAPLDANDELTLLEEAQEPSVDEIEGWFKQPFPSSEKDELNYALDGWLSFSRQRFYHIGVDLELRSIDSWGDTGDSLRSDDRISQSRRIEVGRFEYFDTPGLSVLVRVIEVEKPDFDALREEERQQRLDEPAPPLGQ